MPTREPVTLESLAATGCELMTELGGLRTELGVLRVDMRVLIAAAKRLDNTGSAMLEELRLLVAQHQINTTREQR
jgi:hypothetical protein